MGTRGPRWTEEPRYRAELVGSLAILKIRLSVGLKEPQSDFCSGEYSLIWL